MKQNQQSTVAAILAAVLAGILSLVITVEKFHFDRTFKETNVSSEGYDQKYIDMVSRLEEVLASRASFGYIGGKDPMTGKVRTIVGAPVVAGRSRAQGSAPAAGSRDQLRLTAIIFDEKKNDYSAIVMDGERSSSLEVGDRVRGRVVRKIAKEGIVLESDNQVFIYDISGNVTVKGK